MQHNLTIQKLSFKNSIKHQTEEKGNSNFRTNQHQNIPWPTLCRYLFYYQTFTNELKAKLKQQQNKKNKTFYFNLLENPQNNLFCLHLFFGGFTQTFIHSIV